MKQRLCGGGDTEVQLWSERRMSSRHQVLNKGIIYLPNTYSSAYWPIKAPKTSPVTVSMAVMCYTTSSSLMAGQRRTLCNFLSCCWDKWCISAGILNQRARNSQVHADKISLCDVLPLRVLHRVDEKRICNKESTRCSNIWRLQDTNVILFHENETSTASTGNELVN